MRANQLEDLIPGLREARDKERQNRALAFSDIPWTVCGLDVVVLTPRHRLEFQLVRNAFTVGGTVTQADVFQFLWRLNPSFKKRVWFGSFAWFARRKVALAVKELDMDSATLEILTYLASMLQDLPEGGGTRDTSNPPENYVHWLSCEANFYLARYNGFSVPVLMDTPYLVLQQLYRAYRLSNETHPNFINASDKLIGDYMRANAPRRDN
jgi:hypothetical protein